MFTKLESMYRKAYTMLIVVLAALFWLAGDNLQDTESQISSDVQELLDQAHEKLDEADEPGALELFETVLDSDPENYEALWNLSILYSKKGHRLDNEEEMRTFYRKGKELAQSALDHHSDKSYSHYAFAVAIGRISEIDSPRERVRASEEIKKYVDKALELDSENEAAWHLLGVWHTRAANLTRAERWAANLLFGGAPEGASNSEAEECLKKAIELDPDNILFHLDLARFYKIVERREEAIEVLRITVELEPKVMDDPDHLEEARQMLAELS
jgi:regulator of microtubule dynamics protein 3